MKPAKLRPEDLPQGIALAVEAHRLGFFGDTTLEACTGYLRQKAERGLPVQIDQLFTEFCHLDEVQLAATRKDWEALRSLETFDDRRVILREISRGNMGVVYQALDRVVDRVVAIKEILPDRLDGENSGRALERFEREAKALAAINHPTVVRLHEVGRTPRGTPYMVMDYVAGASLRQVIVGTAEGRGLDDLLRPGRAEVLEGGDHRLEVAQVARWGVQLADGLAACHGVGILHRDVKPANVLIDEDRRARLADLGIALDLHAERLTNTGEAVGTPLYMAREMFVGKRDGEQPGPPSDVYSLGATLYEALSGKPPYMAGDARKLLVAIYNGGATPLRELRADVPEPLEAVIMRCLRVEPEERYQTAAELSAALAPFAGGGAGAGAPPAAESAERSRLVPLLAGVVLLLMFLVALRALSAQAS